ncbi:hypothetical protein SAMN05216548_104229 [Faunimonas pinastri]|uniref:N-acetyltransferase domain-containing protein n=1 Tax=Faunimonas pinastri TaxID=1855383 RepID=A0A1H9FW33_9HYPH|nr:GNAT family N-acetyltransferase [Faunimonas pinastri]SEQ42112.1 hypothetical protein SAMN05216548_104229 [Faunimonas pinastri]
MASETEIRLEETGSGGVYVLRPEAGEAARMTFSRAGDHLIVIDHTEVPEAFRGQGIGLKLVQRAVEDARRSGRKIIPLCPFARAQFQRHPDYSDVLES